VKAVCPHFRHKTGDVKRWTPKWGPTREFHPEVSKIQTLAQKMLEIQRPQYSISLPSLTKAATPSQRAQAGRARPRCSGSRPADGLRTWTTNASDARWGGPKVRAIKINYSLWGCEYIWNIYVLYIYIYVHSIRISMAARDMLLLLKFGFRVYDSRSKSRKSI